ncbi:hypothetical protein D3C76_1104650 [compost metagenome]
MLAQGLLGLRLDLQPPRLLARLDQLVQLQAGGACAFADLVDSAEQLVDAGGLAQRMLLGRIQLFLDALAPLHR